MRVLVVHNEYGGFSGEEAGVERQAELLREHGHEIVFFRRRSADINDLFLGRARAFFSGIYSFSSKKVMQGLLREYRPDIVHIHNLFPLISPSVLGVCRKAGVPVVMTVHNYRLVCPNGLHMSKGRYEICEKCCGGREYWCIIRNCEQSYAKSLGYALRGYVARRLGFFKKNVTVFECLTEFQRNRLITEGHPMESLQVVPNMYPMDAEILGSLPDLGHFAAYVGRISPEKGVELLLSAAEQLPSTPFRLAGNYNAMPHLVRRASRNVSFLGNLNKQVLSRFYAESRFVILCSTWFEGFPMTIVEAMVHARAVIAPRIGGLPEIVADGITGLLFEPGDAEDLAEKIQYLWDRPDLCRQMGQAGQEKACREYSPEKHYDRLMAVYKKAIKLGPGGFCPGSQGR